MPLPFLLGLLGVMSAGVMGSAFVDSKQEAYSIKEIAQKLGTTEYKVRKAIKDLHITPCEENGRNGFLISKADTERIVEALQKDASPSSSTPNISLEDMKDTVKLNQLLTLYRQQLEREKLQTERTLLDYEEGSLEYKKAALDRKIKEKDLELTIQALQFQLENEEKNK